MKRQFYPFLTWCCFFYGCTTPQPTGSLANGGFDDERNIRSIQFINSTELFDPWDLHVTNKTIIVGNLKGEPLVEIYDDTGRLLKKVINRGRKANEIRAIGSIQSLEGTDEILIYDLHERKILNLNLNQALVNNEVDSILPLRPKDKNVAYNKILFTKHGYLIGGNITNHGRIAKLNKIGKPEQYYLHYPAKIDTNLSDDNNIGIYSSGLALSPDSKHLGIVTYNCDMVDLMDVTESGLDSIWSSHQSKPKGVRVQTLGGAKQYYLTEESEVGYLDADATNRYFYALYSGKSMGSDDYYHADLIRIFSWDGKKKIQLRSDKPLRRISVSGDDKYLYAISMNEKQEPIVVKFDISL